MDKTNDSDIDDLLLKYSKPESSYETTAATSTSVKTALKRKNQNGTPNSKTSKRKRIASDNKNDTNTNDVTTTSGRNITSSIVTSTPKISLKSKRRTTKNLENLSPILGNTILTTNNTEHNTTNNDSVQIIEGPIIPRKRRIPSVQATEDSVIVLSEENDTDVEIVQGPSTSVSIPRRNLRRKNRSRTRSGNKKCSGAVISLEPSETVDEEEDHSQQQSLTNGLRNCPVCLSPFDNKSQISSTICGHVYCTPCILKLKSCPICRKKLTKRNIHPLFI